MKKALLIIPFLLLTSCAPILSPPTEEQVVSDVPIVEEVKKVKVISNALTRITKKPFGIKISPQDSPVSPEKFSGYHTGVDFEILEDEEDADVEIFALCDGPLVLKRMATGYGGVAMQGCVMENRDVTVLYGHLDLKSIEADVGDEIKKGQKIGILGDGYSKETDGERKHLHLSIHKGKGTNLLGYVQDAKLLSKWVNPISLWMIASP